MGIHQLEVLGNGDIHLNGEMLIRFYGEDCDVVSRDNYRETLEGALYDAYQTSEELEDGDQIFLGEWCCVAHCQHVHVHMAEGWAERMALALTEL